MKYILWNSRSALIRPSEKRTICSNRKMYERRTRVLSVGVQETGLVTQDVIDLNDLSRDGGIDVRGSLDGLDGSNGVYE